MSIKSVFGPMGSSMANYGLDNLKELKKMSGQEVKFGPNKMPRKSKQFWLLFGYKGLFWRLVKIIGIRHAWRQARFGGKT